MPAIVWRRTILFRSMAKLTKRDIVVAISNQTGMVQHQVFDIVQRTLDKITDSLASNVPVELRNFGIFQPRLSKPRVVRNCCLVDLDFDLHVVW